MFCDVEIARRCATKEEANRIDRGEWSGGVKASTDGKEGVVFELGGKTAYEDSSKTTEECPSGKDAVVYDCDAIAGCSQCVDDSTEGGVIGQGRTYANYEKFCEAFCEVRKFQTQAHGVVCAIATHVNQQRMRESNQNACRLETATISPDWVDPIKRTMEKTSGTMMALTATGQAFARITSPSLEGSIDANATVVRTRVELSPRTGQFINDVDTPRTRRVLEHLDIELGSTSIGSLPVSTSSVSLISPAVLETTSDGSIRIRRQDALFALTGVVGGQRYENLGSPSQDIVGRLTTSGHLTLDVRSVQAFRSLIPGIDIQGTTDVTFRVDSDLVPDGDGDGIPDAQEVCPNGSKTDTTPPVFTFVPAAITVDRCSGANIGTAQAKDPCGVTVVNDAPSVFRLGTTTVTWFARDERGNTATATQQVTVVLGSDPLCCPSTSNIIVGTSNNDILTGTNGVDCIIGLGGQDTITGGAGDDLLSGGDGDDRVFGGEGNDRIAGGSGQDQLFGGPGNDDVSGGDGDDVCQGEIGNDTISGGQGQDNLNGGDGNDRLSGNDGDDVLQSGSGVDNLDGGGIHDRCIGNSATTFVRCERIQR